MEEGRGWNEKERKSKNILMFEKRVEMNKIRYGGIRGGKLVIMRAKVIAWSHVMLCEKGGGGAQYSTLQPLIILISSWSTTRGGKAPSSMNTSFYTPIKTLPYLTSKVGT